MKRKMIMGLRITKIVCNKVLPNTKDKEKNLLDSLFPKGLFIAKSSEEENEKGQYNYCLKCLQRREYICKTKNNHSCIEKI